MSRLGRWVWLALACWAVASTAVAQPDVIVTLDATPMRARVNDVIRLEVRVRARGGSIEGLELDDLQKHPELEIVSQQTMRPVQFSFGFGSGVQVDSSLAHIYMMRATEAGEYEVSPAVAKVDGNDYRSQPVTIVVTGTNAASPTTSPASPDATDLAADDELSGARVDEQAFLRTVVEPESAYLGQQVDVTVYLYTRLRLGPQSVVPSKPEMDGFWVHEDPVTTLEPESATVRGARYRVYPLYRAAAFPQRAGELEIGPPKVTFDVAGMSFFDTPQRVERDGVPVTIDVKPLPSPVPAGAVVGRYGLRARLDRTTVSTGDAVTVRVEAGGAGNVQDLRLELPPMPGVRVLQPVIRDQEQLRNGVLTGTRTWEWIVIAERPGDHRVPPITLRYFDPETESYASASTPELAFLATGEAKPAPAAIEPADAPRGEDVAAFGPIRMYSALGRGRAPVRQRGWFAWALAVPPLGFVLLVLGAGVARRRERRSTTASAVQRRLLRDARGALDGDDPRAFYDRIVASLTHALDVRLGEPVSGLPHAALRGRLRGAGFDEDLTERVINELEGADFARFAASGVDRAEMTRCLDRASTIVERIQRTRAHS